VNWHPVPATSGAKIKHTELAWTLNFWFAMQVVIKVQYYYAGMKWNIMYSSWQSLASSCSCKCCAVQRHSSSSSNSNKSNSSVIVMVMHLPLSNYTILPLLLSLDHHHHHQYRPIQYQ
jgi:hypothetical protein